MTNDEPRVDNLNAGETQSIEETGNTAEQLNAALDPGEGWAAYCTRCDYESSGHYDVEEAIEAFEEDGGDVQTRLLGKSHVRLHCPEGHNGVRFKKVKMLDPDLMKDLMEGKA